jgi:hypothetical protein
VPASLSQIDRERSLTEHPWTLPFPNIRCRGHHLKTASFAEFPRGRLLARSTHILSASEGSMTLEMAALHSVQGDMKPIRRK